MFDHKTAVDFIIDQGDEFDPNTVPGFEERDSAGEFQGMSAEGIRNKLLAEAEMQDYHDDEADAMVEEDRRREVEDD